MNPIQFGAAQVTVDKYKLSSMSRNEFSARRYLKMKSLFNKTDAFLAESKTRSKLERMSDYAQISIMGSSTYNYTNSRPFLEASIRVRDPETGHKLSSTAKQKLGEPVVVFLTRVLLRAAWWDKKLGNPPGQPKPDQGKDKSRNYTFNQ